MAFAKQNRLKGKREFSQVFFGERPVVSESFSLRVSRGHTERTPKFAVVVPAKIIALSTTRNLFRRRITEVMARIIRRIPMKSGTRAVVSVRVKQLPETVELEREILLLMKKSGIVSLPAIT